MRTGLLLLMSSILIQGCSSYPAPIISLEQPPSTKITTHLVERGDTLYSIAWRYDLTVDMLAQINRLSEPYVIKQGQVLHLDPQDSASTAPKQAVEKIADKARNVARRVVNSVKKPKSSPAQEKSAVIANTAKDLNWQNPVKGKVVENYNPKALRKGLVFAAKGGSSVSPVANGRVVYVGDGLRDYGKLVIIKHTDELLSAYGHNQVILVREGQAVNNKEVISKLGSSGRLYFEIRKNGQPVDPKSFLR